MLLEHEPLSTASDTKRENKPTLLSRRRILHTLGWGGLGAALTAGRAHHNANQIQYIHEDIPLRVPNTLMGLQMAFLSDVHIGGNVDALAAQISTQTHMLLSGGTPKNTMILHGGDWLCCKTRLSDATSRDTLDKVTPVLFRGLEQFANFGVEGNHDHDSPEFERYFRGKLESEHGMHILRAPEDRQYFTYGEEKIALHGLHTLGTHMRFLPEQEREELLDQYIGELNHGPQAMNVCLMHNPDGLEYLLRRLKATGKRIEKPTFFLAGHTHGAMFNLPGVRGVSLAACSLEFDRFNGMHKPSGEYADTGEWALRISNGIGNSPYRAARLNAPPEVLCFHFTQHA